MRSKIPVVIPARNEASRILDTISSIREIGEFVGIEMLLVVVDDGSKDSTAEIAEAAGCIVVKLPDRGYSALGKPELADTHNAGFNYISNLGIDFEFVMVIGSDTTFIPNYLELLLLEMDQNPNLVMCAGMINGLRTNPTAVRGSGRIIRYSFWKQLGECLPNTYYGWESYPVVYACAHGYETKTVYSALMFTSRAPLHGVDWFRYGIAMKENGSIFPYVILRALKAARYISIKQGWRLILGYFSKVKNRYPEVMRAFTKGYQRKRLFHFLTFRS